MRNFAQIVFDALSTSVKNITILSLRSYEYVSNSAHCGFILAGATVVDDWAGILR